ERALVAERFGLADAAPVVCEPFRQWVLEDHFPAGRPALEMVGVEFVQDVAAYELMKLRILNGGHAAIAYPSALVGHHFVHEAMADPLIARWLDTLERQEIVPTLARIPGVSYDASPPRWRSGSRTPEAGAPTGACAPDGRTRRPRSTLPPPRRPWPADR